MAFDGKVSDCTKVAPVYDRDNPPTRMSEAIRMAVADVEAQERSGVEYDWDMCEVCTAGAVCRRADLGFWHVLTPASKVPESWQSVLDALSILTAPNEYDPDDIQGKPGLLSAWGMWPKGFADDPAFEWSTPGYTADPVAFKRDMLALADRLEAEGS